MKVVRTIALIVVVVMLVGAFALVASCGGHVSKSSNIIDGSIAVARDNYYHVLLSVDMSRMRDVQFRALLRRMAVQGMILKCLYLMMFHIETGQMQIR